MYNYSYLSMKKQIMNKIFTKLTIYKNYYTALINSDLYQMTQIKIGSSFLNYQVECFCFQCWGDKIPSKRRNSSHFICTGAHRKQTFRIPMLSSCENRVNRAQGNPMAYCKVSAIIASGKELRSRITVALPDPLKLKIQTLS